MSRFVLQNNFIKVYIFRFSINIFIKNKKSDLCFGDRVAVLNVKFFEYGESIQEHENLDILKFV
jgi:hypothetical protein